MTIIIMGNIASGKTTVARNLATALKTKHYGIDLYRRRYGNGTNQGEFTAQDKFLETLQTTPGIFEILGRGFLSYLVFKEISTLAKKPLLIFVNTPANTCLERYKARGIHRFKLPEHWGSITPEQIIQEYNLPEVRNFFNCAPQLQITNTNQPQVAVRQVLDHLHNKEYA